MLENLLYSPVAAEPISDGSVDTHEGQSQPYRSYLTRPGSQPGGFTDESASQVFGSVATEDFSENDRAEIELTKRIAWGKEKKDRLEQAKADAQFPAIQKNIEDSRSRADAVLSELRSARESLNAPPPTLVQGQLGLGDLLAQGIGMLFGGRPDQLLTEGLAGADKRNQLSYQNDLNKYQLNRENLGQFVQFLERQVLGEQNAQSQLEELGVRASIDAEQTSQQQGFQSQEADKQREFQEREKAWTQLYSASNDGEVLAAAQRLTALDPVNAPDQITIDKAVNSARTRRQAAALDYYKATVGKMIEAYQGVVPDTVKADLEQRIQAIAKQFDIDPSIFGEIPTEAFYSRQLSDEKLAQVKDEWKDRFKWMSEKEKNDHSEALAKIRIASQRISVSRQQANTSAARLEWDKIKGTVSGELKSWQTKLNTQTLTLKGIEGQLDAVNAKLGAKDAKGKAKYIPYAEKIDLQNKKRDLELKREGVKAQLDEIRSHLDEIEGVSKDLGANLGSAAGTGTYQTRSGATVRF